jgi:hypothetical protein
MPNVTFNPGSLPGSTVDVLDRIATTIPGALNLLPSSTTGVNELNNYAAAGTAGTYVFARHRNRRCVQITPTGGGVKGQGWRPPEWTPPFDATDMSPGAFMNPAQVVAVFDWHVAAALGGATPGWANDTTPMFFLPSSASSLVSTSVIGGAGPHLGGFGVFLNNVGGVALYEYVSWSSGAPGSVLERVTIGASVVPDLTKWSTFRFIIVGAASGRPARLTVQANGVDVVVNRTFGSGLLQLPSVAAAGATGLLTCWAQRGVADTMFLAMDAKLGRFLPNGTQLQDQ